MREAYEVKVRGRLGPGAKDVRSTDVLGRILEYESWGCSWKADPRHRKSVLNIVASMRKQSRDDDWGQGGSQRGGRGNENP